MDISTRTKELSRLFSYHQKVKLEGTTQSIVPFDFVQTNYEAEIKELQKALATTDFCPVTDDCITENLRFRYTIFTPDENATYDKAILLLHGLNERSWDKYLTWAEYLVAHTGRPVILFPIAFHMNRSPQLWNNPRAILPWVEARKKENANLTNTTFANVALSYRISKQPLRFYASGLQSVYNVQQLATDIKSGQHPMFKENTSINIFSYSIGAFLSQILLLSNTDGLFTDSKLFMFCGGSIFSFMNGNARDILDKEANTRLMDFYVHRFIKEYPIPTSVEGISLEEAFRMMLCPEVMQERRESFFQSAYKRIQAISLKKDVVIPTEGIMKALGNASRNILHELDFGFGYSHQIPFPMQSKNDNSSVNQAFNQVFDKASNFLC